MIRSGIFIFVLGLSLAPPALAFQVIGVADGDTLTILRNRAPLKIRLAEIDAPEKSQAFGNRSKQSLVQLCAGKDAVYEVQNVDRYGRTVARVSCNGVDANRAQVERGVAWVYLRYNRDRSLFKTEQLARNAKRGLWADPQPVPPWEWRKLARAPKKTMGVVNTSKRRNQDKLAKHL